MRRITVYRILRGSGGKVGYLYKMQKDVQSFAEVISAALKVETEIIDEDLIVVGGTSHILKGFLLAPAHSNALITRHVLERKHPFVLTDPGKNPLCATCSVSNDCYYTVGLYYPIIVRGVCYGVISLVGFNEQQKDTIVANRNAYMDFTGKMADLLASKIQELMAIEESIRANEYLETIIASVHEGIISCDADGIITCFNKTAEQKLGLRNNEAIGRHISEVVPDSPLNTALIKRESLYEKNVQCENFRGEKINLISNVTIIKDGDTIIGAVESFTSEEALFRVAHRLVTGDNYVAFDKIIGNSAVINTTKQNALSIAKSPSTVLITGESGTGKELFARAIHNASLRAKNPFIAINCSAIPESLLESELFGYEKGAFTGARTNGKPGMFELVKGGTIFLDEIGDMTLTLQVKILRVLQERMIQRIGGAKTVAIDVRIIAATHQNLKERIASKQFREDLFYRLNVIPINIPPLRDRREDITLLVEYMCQKFSAILNRNICGLTQEAMQIILDYNWPGNVRELENAIEYAVNYSNKEIIEKSNLPHWLFNSAEVAVNNRLGNLKEELIVREKQLLSEALHASGSSLAAKKQIATTFGMDLSTLYRKLKMYDLQ